MLVALLSLTALGATAGLLAAALFHVRYRAAWNGSWNGLSSDDPAFPHAGSLRLEIGFPGFMKPLGAARAADPAADARPAQSIPPPPPSSAGSMPAARSTGEDSAAAAERAASPRAEANPTASTRATEDTQPWTHGVENEASGRDEDSGGGTAPRTARKPRFWRDPNRLRRALFRVATDGPAWGFLRRFALGTVRRAVRLLGLRATVAVGHPDPARLGRAAGAWHAFAPVASYAPIARDVAVEFRFQDRRPTLDARAEGAFSALSLLAFGGATIATFPWIGLGRRIWHGWRHSELTGWRAWTYAKIQKL